MSIIVKLVKQSENGCNVQRRNVVFVTALRLNKGQMQQLVSLPMLFPLPQP